MPQTSPACAVRSRSPLPLALTQSLRLRFGALACCLAVVGALAATGFARVEHYVTAAAAASGGAEGGRPEGAGVRALPAQAHARPLLEAAAHNAARSRRLALAGTAAAALLALSFAAGLNRRLARPLRALVVALGGPEGARRSGPVDDLDHATEAAAALRSEVLRTARNLESARRTSLLLARSNDQLEGFVRSVSHDLKAPLATTRGYLAMAHEELSGGNAAGALELLDRCAAALVRADQLVVDLLELARMGGGGEPRWLSLDDAVARALDDLEDSRGWVGARIERGGDLGQVFMDPRALHQVLSNVLNNALKYGCSGPEPTIRVHARGGPSGACELLVSDNGVGVPEHERGRIFDPFARLSSDGEGSGLGLSLVERAMADAGGVVLVEETPGGGATFVLRFPVAHAAEEAPGRIAATHAA